MVIRNSVLLLEQLSEIEKSIQQMERLLDEMGVKEEKEKLIRMILAKKQILSSGQSHH